MLKSSTTCVRLYLPVSSVGDPGESSAYLDDSDAVDDEGEGKDGYGSLNGTRYSRNSVRLKLTLTS